VILDLGLQELFIRNKMKKGENFIEVLAEGAEFEMVFVEGGEFWMGDDNGVLTREKPAHKVSLDDCYIGKYLLTQRVWLEVLGENPSFFESGNRPVETVSWNEVQKFIQMLNIRTGKAYRLPTEAEWEYAAKGGQKSRGFLYAGSDKLDEVGFYYRNSDLETKHVGFLFPNELGLYDMSGNVYEWCQDWFDSNYYEFCAKQGMVFNPTGPENGDYRVVRSGSWLNGFEEDCRSSYRGGNGPKDRSNYLGFRLVLVPT
jgi:formylglycine-generating enzyme required for sulfatase activity